MNERIKVYVRARAFTEAELISQEAPVVSQIDLKMLSLSQDNHPSIDYEFDQFLWSVDDFRKDHTGALIPTSDRYADQEKVFTLIKSDIITSLNNGYNYCLFAYGQTGSGKSYSISGNKANPGLLYKFFNLVLEETKDNQNSKIKVSMYQVYREEIFDLLELTAVKKTIRGSGKDIKIKGLKKEIVFCLSQVIELYEKGSRLRATAATKMNYNSSRSHCDFRTTVSIDGKKSTFHIIDLAGSERTENSNLKGLQLQEGIKINPILVCLRQSY